MSITVNQTGKNLRLKIYNEVSESHKVEKQCFRFCLNYKCLCLLSKFHPLLSSISSVQFSSDTQSCLTLCDPMDCSTPGLPVHHQFLELTQTHVHKVSDAIQPSHLSSLSPPAFNLFQHQGLFK